MYKDEIEKIKYYRAAIIDKYKKQGVIIDKNKLQQQIDKLDTKIAIFSQRYIQSGSEFDVEKFNAQKEDIYKDLCVLYKVFYDLIQENITSVQAYIKCNLAALEEKAKKFKYLVDSESVSVYGKTVYHATNNFDQYYDDGQEVINLGKVSIPSGSIIACLLSSGEVEQKNIEFVFDDKNMVSAYGYNKDTLKIVGNYIVNNDKQKLDSIKFDRHNIKTALSLNKDNTYRLYLNKDKITIKNLDTNITGYVDKVAGINYTTKDHEEIHCYIYGASYIELNENHTPEYRNIHTTSISNPSKIQEILIRAEHGYVFNIITDGEVYADKKDAYINNAKFMINEDVNNITDYMIEEINNSTDTVFDNVKVIINNANQSIYDIDYIVIKAMQLEDIVV